MRKKSEFDFFFGKKFQLRLKHRKKTQMVSAKELVCILPLPHDLCHLVWEHHIVHERYRAVQLQLNWVVEDMRSIAECVVKDEYGTHNVDRIEHLFVRNFKPSCCTFRLFCRSV